MPREMDRHSGTGRPIKPENKRDGAGKGNWGENVDPTILERGVQKELHNTELPLAPTDANTQSKPRNLGEIEAADQNEEDLPQTSFDEYFKQRETGTTGPAWSA